MTPQRVQLSRTKGWRKPDNTIVVARPSRWGNPFVEVEARYGRDRALVLYREMAMGGWSPSLVADFTDEFVHQIYEIQHAWRKRIGGHPLDAIRRELHGANLACWCPLDQACHGDVLLELAANR